MCDVT